MSVSHAQYKPVVLNLCWRETNPDLWFCERVAQKILTQVNSHVLFYCRTKSVTQY